MRTVPAAACGPGETAAGGAAVAVDDAGETRTGRLAVVRVAAGRAVGDVRTGDGVADGTSWPGPRDSRASARFTAAPVSC